jgi:Glycosyltransferase family 87
MLKKWFLLAAESDKLAIAIVFFLVTISIAQSISYTVHSGGTDLRTRIVGARLLYTNESPYFYKWHPGDPERFIDPNNNYLTAVNGVTASPGFLYFQSVLTWMSYPHIRIIWTIFQYVSCFSIFWLLLFKKDINRLNRIYILFIGGVFFLCSDIWFFNIERGQAYIVFPLFMCLIYQLQSIKTPWSIFMAGVLLAIAIYCRPNFIFFGLPLLLNFNKHFALGLLSMGLILLIHAFIKMDLWRDYFQAISFHTVINNETVASFHQHDIIYPSIIEGSKNLTTYKSFNVIGLPSVRWFFIRYPSIPEYMYLLLYAITASVIIIFFKKIIKKNNPPSVILIGFILYIISEYFVPSQRSGYNLIQWIFPIILILSKKEVSKIQVILITIACCLLIGFPFTIRMLQAGGEALLIYCVIDNARTISSQPFKA